MQEVLEDWLRLNSLFPIKILGSSCNLPNYENELHSFANLKNVNGYLIWESTRQ